MKNILLLLFLFIFIPQLVKSQNNSKGAIMLGGSFKMDQIDKQNFRFEGSLLTCYYIGRNFATGIQASYLAFILGTPRFHGDLASDIFLRCHLPFFSMLFMQAGLGTSFSTGTKSILFYLDPKVGLDWHINSVVVLEFSIGPTLNFNGEFGPISSNIGLLIRLNNK